MGFYAGTEMSGMFAISEAMSIAVHLCVHLACNPETFVSTRKVAKTFRFSAHHVAKVVQKLTRAGLLATVRGGQGGARLARPMKQISLFDIHDALEDLDLSCCLLDKRACPGGACLLGCWISEENKRIVELMKKTSLEQVVKSMTIGRIARARSGK